MRRNIVYRPPQVSAR